jgi:hypothetical protein
LAQNVDGVLYRLLQASTRLAPDALGQFVAVETLRGGFFDTTIFMVDLEQIIVVPLPPVHGFGPLDIDSTNCRTGFRT